MLFGFNPSKCKTQCRLGVGRIKLLRNKKQIAMKSLRREVAELMKQGKQGNARIRVEAVMREHRMLQAFEILELYLELLAVRAELLAKTKEIPPDMVEAISSLIYAGERVSTDLAEVSMVAKLLVGKYSGVYKDAGFPHEVVSDLTCRKWQVNDDLVTCLAVSAPMPEEKLAFLEDIAREHDVAFDRDAAALDMLQPGGKQAAVAAYPVETLSAGGSVPGRQHAGPPPLAAGWQPPAVAPPPPASATQPAGWHPPGAGQQQQQAPSLLRLASGGTVLTRPGFAVDPGMTDLPSAAADVPTRKGQEGWQPPAPEDLNSKGRSFGRHVDATAAWRHTRQHGASGGSGGGSQASGSEGPQQQQQPGGGAGAADPWAGLQTGASPGLQHHPSDASVTGPPLAAFPGTAASSGASTPTLGDKPFTPGTSYADALAAAAAAKHHSNLAQQAALRAEEFAAGQQADFKRMGNRATGGSGGTSGDQSPGGDDGHSGGGGDNGGGGQHLVPRTLSEIRRAYDAAPGPPAKPGSAASGPPSAPPAQGQAQAPAEDLPSGDIPALPSVPTGGQGPPPPVRDELDELTRRFEMLKKR